MMQIARINKVVKKVVALQKDAGGNSTPVVLYKKDNDKKKMSRPLRPVEKAVRRVATAQVAAVQSYLDRHDRSNSKNQDGWIQDLVPNLVKAGKRGQKKLRITHSIMN